MRMRAIAHPGRRTMLRLVWDEERPATELADAAGMSKSAASQHLKLLRDAGLVTRSGRRQPPPLPSRPGTGRRDRLVPRRVLGRRHCSDSARPPNRWRANAATVAIRRSGRRREARRPGADGARAGAGAVRAADRPGAVRAVDGRRRNTRSSPGWRRALDARQRRHLLRASTSSSCRRAGSSSRTGGSVPTSRSRPARPPSRSTSPPLPTRPPCCGWSIAASTISPPAPTTADGRTTSTGSAGGRKVRPSGPIRSRRSACRHPQSCADERGDASRRGEVLGPRRAVARTGRRDPFDDDGPAVPALERRLLRVVRSTHRRPTRQARREPRRRTRRLRTSQLVRAGRSPVPRVGSRSRKLDRRTWKRLLDEALEFAIDHPAPAKKKRRSSAATVDHA